MAVSLEVNVKELTFPKNKTSTLTIQVQSKNGIYLMPVEMTHNLPKCFSFNQSKTIKIPATVEVTYDHRVQLENEVIPSEMYIKFNQNIFSPNQAGAVTVKVKLWEESKRSESLECNLCLLPFVDNNPDLIPRILPACGHTLCETCVKKLKSATGQVQCPYDRINSQVKNEEQFPKNFLIIDMLREMSLAEAIKKQTETQPCENPDVPCFENPSHEATCHCLSCKAEFCVNCFSATHAAKIFANHKSVSLEERPAVLPSCTVHSDKLACFVCKDDTCKSESKLFCEECQLENLHKSHEHENLTDQIAKNKTALRDMARNLKMSEKFLELHLNTTQGCAESFDKSTAAYKKKAESVSTYFDEKKRQALKRLETFVDAKKMIFETKSKETETTIETSTGYRREIEKMLKQASELHDVSEILKKTRALTNPRPEAGEPLVPFGSLYIPDDVTVDKISPIMRTDSEENKSSSSSTEALAVMRTRSRLIAHAIRKK